MTSKKDQLQSSEAEGARTLKTLWTLIPKPQKFAIPLILVALVVNTLLEVVGIGLLVPLLNLLTREEKSSTDSILEPILNFVGATTQLQMLTAGLLSIGVVVLVKNAILAVTMFFQTRQSSIVRKSLEIRVFGQYLNADYKFHLNSNSAILSRNLITEVEEVFSRALMPAFVLMAESLTAIGVLLLLIYLEPIPTLVLFFFFGVCFAVYTRAFSPLLCRLGHERADLMGEGFKIISETLGGIKEIKVLRREGFFRNRFYANRDESARAAARTEAMHQVPTYLVELWGVFGLLIVVFTLVLQDRSSQTVVSTLGLFVGASLRLIPALNRMMISTQALKVAKPAIQVIHREIRIPAPTRDQFMTNELLEELEFRDVSFHYDSNPKPVLKNAAFRIRSGESIGIVGPSGTGKSTLVDLLLGLLEPTSGQILIDGKSIDFTKVIWKPQVGYVPQHIFLMDTSIRNNIALGVAEAEISDSKLARSIGLAQLSDFIDSLPDGIHTLTGERGVRLSGGQRQRIGIARALYSDPSMLVLDEATSALDAQTEAEIISTLEFLHGRITMILISHRSSVLVFCDRVLRLEEGLLTQIT